jgi:hypothetical protein
MLFSRHTKRREFITLLGAVAVWPLAARRPGHGRDDLKSNIQVSVNV